MVTTARLPVHQSAPPRTASGSKGGGDAELTCRARSRARPTSQMLRHLHLVRVRLAG